MDEFDEFADGGSGPDDGFGSAMNDDALGDDPMGDAAVDGDEDPSSPFDDFEDAPVPGGDDLDAFDFDDTAGGLEDGIDDAFDVDDDFDDEPAETGADETAYAATYEDALVADADNPAAFPPELDLDLPEPVDGYPWVDLDTLGQTETEPWVNTVESSDFAAADLDDVASEALSRFWER